MVRSVKLDSMEVSGTDLLYCGKKIARLPLPQQAAEKQ